MSTRTLAMLALLTGFAVLGLSGYFLSLGLHGVQPLNGAYGDQAILAFELAQTPEELAVVIGADAASPEAQAVRAQMDHANRVDYAYMACYGLFIAFSCACAAKARRRPWLAIGMALGPLAALADAQENFVLLQLTRPDADLAALLPSLHLRTLFKWELLAIVSAMFAAAFVDRRRPGASLGASAIALLALASGGLILFEPAKYLALLSGAIVVVWLWQLGYVARVLLRE